MAKWFIILHTQTNGFHSEVNIMLILKGKSENCKHLMFSDMYGECNKQLRIVHPSDTCEFAESKERGGEK